MSSTCPPGDGGREGRRAWPPDRTHTESGLPSPAMPSVLVATDADWIANDIRSVLGGSDTTVLSVSSGPEVRSTVETSPPDLVIVDLQIGQMGGMAVSLDLRLEEGAGRLPRVPIIMLL